MVVKTNEKILQEHGWTFSDYSSKEKVVIYKKDNFTIGFSMITKEIIPVIHFFDKFSAEDIIKFGEELKAIMISDCMGGGVL
jgi:hypothetical protein